MSFWSFFVSTAKLANSFIYSQRKCIILKIFLNTFSVLNIYLNNIYLNNVLLLFKYNCVDDLFTHIVRCFLLAKIPLQMMLFRATRKQSCANAMSLTVLLPINEGMEGKLTRVITIECCISIKGNVYMVINLNKI